MGKYISPDRMTCEQIQEQVDQEFQRWNHIACNGCQDPYWPDGLNMDLVRNHIIFWYSLLDEKSDISSQVSLFDSPIEAVPRRPIPPVVPLQYMVAGCEHSDRLKGRNVGTLIWGQKGEYQA